MNKRVKIRVMVDGFEYVHCTPADQVPEDAEIIEDDEPWRIADNMGGNLDSMWWSDAPEPYTGEQAKGAFSGVKETFDIDEYLAEMDHQKCEAESVYKVKTTRRYIEDEN